MKRLMKYKRNEEGQSILEFVLVFPILILLIFAIVDLGWLFYSYVSVENSARNAARIACIEYNEVVFTVPVGGGKRIPAGTTKYILSGEEVDTKVYDDCTEVEKRIIDEVTNTIILETANVESVTITYTADTELEGGEEPRFKNRPNGDVIVEVECSIPVFTPVLAKYSDNMRMTLHSSSVYKVEKSVTVQDFES